ncbi:hypothetical protein [Nostoc sp.]|uniref:hypothetical protein n=1 Tax=Nostoc sp. TaxID=1180 RepID=UPI002FF5E6FA
MSLSFKIEMHHIFRRSLAHGQAERPPLPALIPQGYLGIIRLEYEKQLQTQAVAKKVLKMSSFVSEWH